MTEPSLVRRLTTIIAIDVVGFSTLSARDEEHALGLLRTRMAVAETYIRQHRGRVFKLTGDGLLAEFTSPVEAVRAAIEIQEAMRTSNALVEDDERLKLRIGANLGDVIESGDDLMGDAVNVAVRLESIAPVGGVCVSANVYEQIVGKLTLGAEDMGEQHVKNIPRPIHAYRLTAEGAPPKVPEAPRPQPASRRKLAAGLAGAAVVVAASATLVAAWLLPGTPETMPARPVADLTPAAQPPAAPRPFVAADVPFVPDHARREMENYATANGAKALAISVRGNFAFAGNRIDEATAREIALGQCNAVVQRVNPAAREIERCTIYAVGNQVVWSFRTPPLPPPPHLHNVPPAPPVPLAPAAIPLLQDTARTAIAEHYMKADRNRALAIGRNRTEIWVSGDSTAEAIRRALQTCGHVTGRPCFIYALGDQVMVRVPQEFRIVEVFTPQDLSGLEPGQQEAVERYLVADDWRAIAAGRNGRLGIATARASEDAAVDAALRACASAGGTDCAVTTIGPYLVTRK